jgi:glucose-6-phosphate dehydrogenase assembly protein OpcA
MDELGRVRVERVAGVEGELAALWRGAYSDGQPVVRACELNLVVACAGNGDELREVSRLVASVSQSAPGRALVVVPAPAGGRGLEIWVSAHCHRGPSGPQVCCEQVTLEAREDALPLVPRTVLQLLVGEMPVYTVWRRRRVAADPLFAPLAELTDCLIVDGADHADPAAFLRELRAVTVRPGWRCRIADLTWARTEPWREAVASFFDDPVLRPHLGEIARIEVAASGPAAEDGRTVASAYLTGWLASRLGWHPGRGPRTWQSGTGTVVETVFQDATGLPSGDIGAVRMELRARGGRIALAAERDGNRERGYVRLTVTGLSPGCPPRTLQPPSRDGAALLCGILQHTGPDRVYDAALAATG